MKQIRFWFDVISPFAWLAFDRLPQALEGHSHVVEYRPVLLGAMLQHWGQRGPAEIAPKRDWTYRQVAWLARQQGTPLALPAQHPFNPLALQRLALACCAAGGAPNRRVVEALFRHVWCSGGADANEPQRLQALAATLQPQRGPASAEVKDELKLSTQAAIERGVFGVPAFELEGRVFWGLDALPMLAAALAGDPFFDGPWDEAAAPRPAITRG